ncbi:MAG: hypothetical protein Q7N87_03850 [Candidatus Uhrbacteria bacterium]|nr:hypothetical protein [Candidatus Uhrbacteria bacterium]MDP3793606.1 hypothetical protein [Candidatus Uhrbacteria bacterium]
MNMKMFHQVVGVIFGLIALMHLARVIYGWQALIGGWTVPMWVSWVAIVVGAYLAYQAFRLTKK